MSNFLQNMMSIFQEKEKQPPKIKVCWDFLAKMLGFMLLLTDSEQEELGILDNHDPWVLQEIIREYVVPHYRYFPPENQEKIRNSLTYYLATNSEKLDWIFPSRHINLESSGKLFYTIVWQELYGTDEPEPINPDDYEEDCSVAFVNSLAYSGALEKKYNPNDERPSLANVIARLKQNP